MASTNHETVHWDPSRLHFEFRIPNRETRFKSLVLYIAKKCWDDRAYSRTKLYKILFYSDFEAYGRFGLPITGMPYKKFPFGPAPASFMRLQDEMLRDKMIRISRRPVLNRERQCILALQDPDERLFSSQELSVVDSWIDFFRPMTAKAVSQYSHGKAWKLANLGDQIPYDAVFISDEPITDDDVQRAKSLAAKYGWKL